MRIWLLSVTVVILALVFGLYFIGLPDGQKFCATARDRDQNDPPLWEHDGKNHINVGGKACVEDIVDYVNGFRAGPDGLVGTADDRLSLDEEFELIPKLLKQEFIGGYWPMSKWHFNHNAGVLGQMRMLYCDGNEYILVFGNPIASNGYSGRYVFDCYDFQIEGEQRNFFLSNTSYVIYSPNWKSLRAKGFDAHFSMALKAGMSKGYSQANGGWMVEYGYGNLVPALYDGVLMPTLFISNDWASLAVSISTFTEGFISNNFPRISQWIGLSDTSNWNMPMQNQRRWSTRRRPPPVMTS